MLVPAAMIQVKNKIAKQKSKLKNLSTRLFNSKSLVLSQRILKVSTVSILWDLKCAGTVSKMQTKSISTTIRQPKLFCRQQTFLSEKVLTSAFIITRFAFLIADIGQLQKKVFPLISQSIILNAMSAQ